MRSSVVFLAAFVVGCSAEDLEGLDAASAEGSLREVAGAWVDESGVLDRGGELVVHSATTDALGTGHVRYQQRIAGIPVVGGQLLVHTDGGDAVTHTTQRLVRADDLDPNPAIAADLAEQIATDGTLAQVSSSELVVWRKEGVNHLAWRLQLEDFGGPVPARPVVVVDAHTGEIVDGYDNLQTLRNRRTYDANNGWGLPGTLTRTETTPAVGDVPVDRAHLYSGATYEYYSREQGRDSWDGVGGAMVASAHYGTSYDNAFWDGTQTVYGDGGFYFRPMSQSIEVVGHEFTHAVTERTAGLIYSGESGGLNEAMSDIFGATIESFSQSWTVNADTWLIGEDIMLPGVGPALRFMNDPPLDGVSIDNYADYYSGIDVHYSSGIANKAFYLMATDPAFGIRDAADVWYRALTTYLTPSSGFYDARDATTQAAIDLHGAGSAQVAAVEAAWDGVGVRTFTTFATRANLSGVTGTEIRYQYNIPIPGSLSFDLAGGIGDADLYVRQGAPPTVNTYDCASVSSTTTERCIIDPSVAGTWHVLIYAYSTFSGTTYTAAGAPN